VLHKISEVLEPVQPLRSSEIIYNPNAFQFLNQSENLKLENHRVRLVQYLFELIYEIIIIYINTLII
jgi:DNA-binding winged helix-turn-helix (wHTH) protein